MDPRQCAIFMSEYLSGNFLNKNLHSRLVHVLSYCRFGYNVPAFVTLQAVSHLNYMAS